MRYGLLPLFLASSLLAQAPPAFRADATLVTVPVFVTGPDGVAGV